MQTRLLYPLLLLGVLMGGGCAKVEPPDETAGQFSNPIENGLRPADEESSGDPAAPGNPALYRVVFMGDSITAGNGVDEEDAFPSLIRSRVRNTELPFDVVDAGNSGETSSGGLTRIPWLLRNRIDVLILELGGNDALRGISLELTRKNLSGIIEKTLEAYPECRIVVAGMQVPPNLGHEYTSAFSAIFPELASRFDATLIPFLLKDVGGVDDRMQSDGIHPNAKGHAVIAETVWRYLEPVLRDITRRPPVS